VNATNDLEPLHDVDTAPPPPAPRRRAVPIIAFVTSVLLFAGAVTGAVLASGNRSDAQRARAHAEHALRAQRAEAERAQRQLASRRSTERAATAHLSEAMLTVQFISDIANADLKAAGTESQNSVGTSDREVSAYNDAVSRSNLLGEQLLAKVEMLAQQTRSFLPDGVA
jgi:hypothetical protein